MRTEVIAVQTAVSLAFVKAAFGSLFEDVMGAVPERAKRPLVNRVLRSLERGAGRVHLRATNANVSYKTAQKLRQQGIL